MKIKDLSMYGSHIPFLVKAIEKTHGPILDLGMGLSTVVMHMMCKDRHRQITSIEADKDWFEAHLQYQTDWHRIMLVDDWKDAPLEKTHWALVMVDHAPAKQRIKEIKRLTQNADIVLIHDSEPDSNKYFKYSWIYPLFKYRYDYTKCTPNTTALSNTIDVAKLFS